MIRSRRIRAKAAELGFVACGFARADAAAHAGGQLREWLGEGRHGEMGWMEERAAQRASPQGLWPDARSVIALAMSYAPATDPMALAGERDLGRISAYAQGGDYHKTVKKALKALGRWLHERFGGELKVFVDTAPVMEKPLAAAAGIGWQGKHTNLLSREHGNWLFLGIIYTSLELEPDAPANEGMHCGSCTRLHRRLPDRRHHRPAPDRCAGLHFLSDHRASRADPRASIARRSATASTAATIAWRSARGTGLPRAPPPTAPSCRAPSWPRRGWRTCCSSTMPASARCSQARRSSASAATASSAIA